MASDNNLGVLIPALKYMSYHSDENVSNVCRIALSLIYAGKFTDAFKLLYEAAERLNPYKRQKVKGWRQRCLQSSRDGVQRCIVAQALYHLSSAMYCYDDVIKHVQREKVFDVELVA